MLSSVLSDWFATLSLVFGGCCSNAITLEQLTSQYPHAGSLITLIQFLIISIHGLPKHLMWTPYGPRFRPRRIPLIPILVQVALFYLVSLLNNAAFGYRIPMSVHIIFRSGGLIVSMLLGWLISGKTFNITQIISVIVVTLGVIMTTLSASKPTSQSTATNDVYAYATGIAILTLALVFSGFLGLAQDWTYSKYGRPAVPGSQPVSKPNKEGPKAQSASNTPAWQESMFYLHFFALPMFFTLRSDLATQIAAVNAGPKAIFSVNLPTGISSVLAASIPGLSNYSVVPSTTSFVSVAQVTPTALNSTLLAATVMIPKAYLPLLLNTLTQLLCVAGVHRLTTRVSALSVTLILVVRKAVSLVISVVGLGGSRTGPDVDMKMMWFGAFLVLAGTVGYTVGTGRGNASKKTKAE